MPELVHNKTADIHGVRYFPDDPYYRVNPFRSCLHVRDWDLYLGPRSPGMGEGQDWWADWLVF